MKIVFAGLLSFFAIGCAHIAPLREEAFEIKLKDVGTDTRFQKLKQNQYQVTFDDASLIKIVKYNFENEKDMETYLANRRMILHQDFQNNIAPYVGLIEAEKTCVSKVNIKGEIKPVPGGEFFFLEFPVTSERVISECSRNDVWGLMTYHFYACKVANELFEIRYSRSLAADPFNIKAQCE